MDPLLSIKSTQAVAWSSYGVPIEEHGGAPRGFSRRAGDASEEVKRSVIRSILRHSSDLDSGDRALLLAIARLESGFNPDAASRTSSAKGVFQIIDATARGLGLSPGEGFDTERNVRAGILLFRQNAEYVARRFPGTHGDERAALLYAIHHDGPTLAHGGAALAKKEILPYLARFREMVSAME